MSADEHAPDCRLGVLAFGDSITNGGGELQWGVALQSWALWVARGLGLPYTGMAEDGAVVADVVQRQMPALERGPAGRSARYDLGCLYIGVNDVRSPDWDAAEFEHHFQTALEYLRTRCDHVLTVTAPLDLGRPRAGAKVAEMNRVIERMASQVGALVLDLSRFGARNHVMTEHVHPTAFGQVAIAERALDVLAADGLAVVVRPAWLLRYDTTWWTRLRADAAYGYRHLKVSLWAGARVTWLRRRGV
ncbi:MAG TPA: GDSL-type esterase/lipase family protein [Solirubrobacteraceae bacterium]|nr:GDSL-type esterase/lipase family protein [Solirubrobacteraceae bacterium]